MKEEFFKWLGERISEYEVARQRGLQAYVTRINKITEERNDGIPPTESSAGIHAPFDGYLYSWAKGHDVYERTFLAGQFLPWPSEYESYSAGAFTEETKIKTVPKDRIDSFMENYRKLSEEQRKTVRISQGNSWVDSDSKEERCHVYISHCPKDLANAIDYYLMGDIYKLQFIAEKKTEDERAKRDKAHIEGEDVIEGRQVITGIVLAMKWQDSYYGSTLKMMVQDDRGFRVWGSVPSSLSPEREDRISFTATVEQSDDTKFGFFKRPTKASVVNA